MINLLFWKLNVLIFKIKLNVYTKFKSFTTEKYVNLQIKHGLIEYDGCPKRCFCGSTDTEIYNTYYEDSVGLVEHSEKCKKCGTYLGHWAYGNWEV